MKHGRYGFGGWSSRRWSWGLATLLGSHVDVFDWIRYLLFPGWCILRTLTLSTCGTGTRKVWPCLTCAHVSLVFIKKQKKMANVWMVEAWVSMGAASIWTTCLNTIFYGIKVVLTISSFHILPRWLHPLPRPQSTSCVLCFELDPSLMWYLMVQVKLPSNNWLLHITAWYLTVASIRSENGSGQCFRLQTST